MKQFLLTMLLCTAATLNAMAQWNPGDNNQIQIGKQSNIEFSAPSMIRKADGSTILVYRTFGLQTNPETGQKDEKRQFYLYLQILDKDGNKRFEGNGKLISYKPTDTASYGRPNVDTLSNGNIIITFADIREVDDDNYKEVESGDLGDHINIKACKVIAYCYNQEGNSVWSPDGVMLPYHVMDPEANTTFYAGEQIAISGDKIYLAATILEQYTRTDPHTLDPVDSYAHYFEVACLDYDGNILAEKHDSVWQAFNYKIAAAPDGTAYFVYVDEDDHYSVKRLGPDCENIWADAKLVEPYGVVSHEGGAAISFPPSDVIKISDGSVGLVYKAFMPNHFSQCYYNRIYPDGSLLDEHVLLSDTAGIDHDHVIMVEDDILNIAECVKYERADYGEYFLSFNRIKLDGTRLLPKYDGFWLDVNRGVDSSPLCIVHADENYNILTFDVDYVTQIYQSYCYTVSPEGKLLQRKPILNSVYIYDFDNCSENQYAYLLFARDPLGQHGLWIACVDGTDYTNSVELKGELPGIFSVSADKQVQFSKANLEYLPARQTYFFAAHQMFAQTELNRWISEKCLDFEDLYGWGTGDNAIKTSTDDADYPSFKDWGKNEILNTTYEAGTWRTMTKDEWDYLLNGRENAAQKCAIGQITMGKYAPFLGMFLLPDEFEMPQGLEMDMDAQEWTVNAYDAETLLRLEKAGVIFLPATGWRENITINDIEVGGTDRGYHGYYWTATESGADKAQMLYIDKVGPSFDARPRHQGMSVRLVKDTGAPVGIKDVAAPAKENTIRKVLINGKFYIMQGDNLFNAQGARVQ